MYYARRTGAAVLLMVMVAIGSLLFASSAYADGANGPWIADSTKVHLVKYSYQQVLANCFGQGAVYNGVFTEADINNPTNWFRAGKTTAASYILEPADGIWSCNSEVSNQTSAILNTFGWTGNLTGLSAACDLGAIRVSDQGGNPVGWLDSLSQPKSCTDHFADGSWGFRVFPTPDGFTKLPMGSATTKPSALNMVDSAQVKTIIAQKSGLTHIGNDDRYVLDWAAFSGACQPSNGTPMSNGTFSTPLDPNNVHLTNGSTTINVLVVNQDASISYIIYDYVNKSDIYAFPLEQNENSDINGSARKFANCQDLVKDMNSVAVTYSYLVGKQKGQPGSSTSNYNNPAAAAATASKLTCANQVTGAGWFVCPIITGLATLNDGMWGLVKGMLNVNPIESTGALRDAWAGIKNLANIAFVVVFLIIIFSQLTSVGVTNYGVKKMLPRLIIGAILVNVSFLIIQILVDVSNIAGSSMYDFMISLAPENKPTWTGLIGTIAATAATAVIGAAGVAIVGGAAAAFWILLPMAGIAALGLLAAVLTLVFRQALIPVLAILAPLAFVALLLPNTESWFKKWRGMLVSLLMLYPIAAVVFGGAQLAATVIINGNSAWWSLLIGLLVMSLPLFSLPFLARQGGPLLTKVGSSLSGLANRLGKPLADFAAPKRQLAEKKYMSAKPSDVSKFNVGRRMRLSALRGKQADTAKGSAYDRMLGENTDEDILAGKLDKKMGPAVVAREKDAAALRQKQRESALIESGAQNIKRTYGATGTIGAPGKPGGAEKEFAQAFASGDKIKMLSAMSVLAGSGPPGIEKLHSSALGISKSQNPDLYKAFQDELNGVPSLKSKDAALAKMAYSEDMALSDIDRDKGTYFGLSAADSASQTEGSLKRILAIPGAMSRETATEILANETLSGQLTPITKKIVQDIAAGIAPTPTVTSTQTTSQTPNTAQSTTATTGTSPFVVDSSGVVEPNTVRGRAEAKAAEAAQGMTGDTPFVVDHTGAASQPPQAGDVGSHTDEQGRQTPDGTAEGYHDYFNH